jgi:hypothetical protein
LTEKSLRHSGFWLQTWLQKVQYGAASGTCQALTPTRTTSAPITVAGSSVASTGRTTVSPFPAFLAFRFHHL